jgi:uncharacterized protein (TIGR04255 family)
MPGHPYSVQLEFNFYYRRSSLPLDLPAVERRLLARSPLQLVVSQLRFEAVPRATEARVALAIHEQLGGPDGPLRRMEPIQNVQITLGAGQAPTATPTGWRFVSEAADWTASVLPDQATLETTSYEEWEGTFRERLFALVDAISEQLVPPTLQRIGLRYVNRVSEPAVSAPPEWQRYLAPEVLGPILHERLGPGIVAAQQQVDLEATDDLRAIFRHGFFRDLQEGGALTYVLDFDTYQERYSVWNAEEIKTTADRLNDLSLRLFHQVVTDELLTYLRGDGDGR